MTGRAIPVTFLNQTGCRLFGIFHQPERPREDGVAILLLSPGVKARVAPHRLYRKMAERFVALGYPVLRFDFHGLGDSDGEATETYLADLYGAIQMGRYVGDTIAAMDWLQQTYGMSRFVASGLCGGALTGLLAAERDPRIVCLLGLSIPVILDGSNIDFSKFMTNVQLKGTRNRYLGKMKLWDLKVWRSWMRLLTFRSDYRLIVRSLVKPLFGRVRPAGPATAPPKAPADNTNPLFAPAFLRMVGTSRRILLVFAETDRLLFEFDAKFMARHRQSIEPHAAWYEVHVTKQANHIFSFAEWQQDMLDQCCRWLSAESRNQPAVEALVHATD